MNESTESCPPNGFLPAVPGSLEKGEGKAGEIWGCAQWAQGISSRAVLDGRGFLLVAPIEFLLPSPSGTGSLLPGSSVIQTRCWDLVSQPTQHIVLAEPGDPKERDTEERKISKIHRLLQSEHESSVLVKNPIEMDLFPLNFANPRISCSPADYAFLVSGRAEMGAQAEHQASSDVYALSPVLRPGPTHCEGHQGSDDVLQALVLSSSGHDFCYAAELPGGRKPRGPEVFLCVLLFQKRKGGWPKGKKRKPPRDPPVPRAPRTGYVIFLNEQRSPLRARHPDLPFTEITKMLAAQWAQLPQEKKQRYVYEAVEDKQRYIRELQAYQSSKAYRAFLRRRAAHKVQALCGTGTLGCEFESEGLDFSAIDRPWDELKFSAVLRKASTRQAISQGDENDDLYCRTCRQFFSSLHNKREHLLGKQHLQNLTGEFEKDSAECLKHLEPLEGEVGQNLNKGDSEEEAECPDPLPLRGLIPETSFASLDLRFLQEFIFKLLKIKEFELRELRKTLERAQVEQEALQRQLLEFQNRRQRLEVELAGLKTYGVVLEKEFENLNMVLMLSHFGLRVIDTT
ncbi:uncharacterized protein [Sagmatias obliquidens]|uniref:uncharacterized protein n=2 Tax=Delphinidae TaxID=9726 RepID=UPI000F442ABF|nr:uncharacterized protein LOC113619258 [Lagenorhynchus obliquidens]